MPDSLARSLDVLSLKFLKLPALACVQPALSFYTIFNGVTIVTLLFVIFCGTVYFLGQLTEAARIDDARRRRFKTRVLSVLHWGLFLIFPQARHSCVPRTAAQSLQGLTRQRAPRWLCSLPPRRC